MNATLKNSLGILGCLALVCFALLLIQLARAAIELESAAADASTVLQSSNRAIADTEKQLTGKYGLISEWTATARESRKTIDVLQATSLQERAKAAAFSDASTQVVTDLDGVVLQAKATVQSLQETVTGMGGAVASLKADTDAVQIGNYLGRGSTALATTTKSSGAARAGPHLAYVGVVLCPDLLPCGSTPCAARRYR